MENMSVDQIKDAVTSQWTPILGSSGIDEAKTKAALDRLTEENKSEILTEIKGYGIKTDMSEMNEDQALAMAKAQWGVWGKDNIDEKAARADIAKLAGANKIAESSGDGGALGQSKIALMEAKQGMQEANANLEASRAKLAGAQDALQTAQEAYDAAKKDKNMTREQLQEKANEVKKAKDAVDDAKGEVREKFEEAQKKSKEGKEAAAKYSEKANNNVNNFLSANGISKDSVVGAGLLAGVKPADSLAAGLNNIVGQKDFVSGTSITGVKGSWDQKKGGLVGDALQKLTDNPKSGFVLADFKDDSGNWISAEAAQKVISDKEGGTWASRRWDGVDNDATAEAKKVLQQVIDGDKMLKENNLTPDQEAKANEVATEVAGAQEQASSVDKNSAPEVTPMEFGANEANMLDVARLTIELITAYQEGDDISVNENLNIAAADIGEAVGAVDDTALAASSVEGNVSMASMTTGAAQLAAQLLEAATVDMGLLSETVTTTETETEATEPETHTPLSQTLSSTGEGSPSSTPDAEETTETTTEVDDGYRDEIQRRRMNLLKQYINAAIQISEGMNGISHAFYDRADLIAQYANGVQTEAAAFGVVQDAGRYVLLEVLRGTALSSAQMGVEAARLLEEQEVIRNDQNNNN